MTAAIDWENHFCLYEITYCYIAHAKNGQWDQGRIDRGCNLAYFRVSFHYIARFEGLSLTPRTAKLSPCPDENAKRSQRTCDRL